MGEEQENSMPDTTPAKYRSTSASLFRKRMTRAASRRSSRGWNAYMVQVSFYEERAIPRVGRQRSHQLRAVAETVMRTFAATHGMPWDKVEVVSR
ncbi:MAG: hypothetical protein Udaeo2_12560 [Candidatus Udaeobacter sp.]|nr:MAG: hypothetical protein Udaeo2_12560 [Candidatus Udaeobacter sp.]